MRRSFLLALCLCVSLLADPNPKKQTLETIRDLGKSGQSSLSELAKYLTDSDRDIRLEAVKSIIRIGSMRSVDPLLTAVRDNDSSVQSLAIDGLVNAYVPGYVAPKSVPGYLTKGARQVKSIFTDRNDTVVDPDVRVRADVAAALSEKITGGNGVEVRENAALAAGILRANDSVPALEAGLRSKNSEVILECLLALQKIKDPLAGPSAAFLSHDLDQRVQLMALETLGILRSHTSADDIRSAYKNGRDMKIQRAALQALAMLGLSADRTLFQQNLESSDAETRAAALEGLGRIREPEDYPKFKEAFEEANADWRVHAAAAFAMAMNGDNSTEDLGPLALLVEGFSLKARVNISAAYLAELAQKPEARAALGKMLPDQLKERKIGILAALSMSGAPDSVAIIEGYTKDSDHDVAFAAMRARRIAQTRT